MTCRIALLVSSDAALQVVNGYNGAEGTCKQPDLGLSRRFLSPFVQ
jgi:hypothetical protein